MWLKSTSILIFYNDYQAMIPLQEICNRILDQIPVILSKASNSQWSISRKLNSVGLDKIGKIDTRWRYPDIGVDRFDRCSHPFIGNSDHACKIELVTVKIIIEQSWV